MPRQQLQARYVPTNPEHKPHGLQIYPLSTLFFYICANFKYANPALPRS